MTDEEYAQLKNEFNVTDDDIPTNQIMSNTSQVGRLSGTTRAVAQGLSLGFADELEAFIKSGFNDQDYDENVKLVRDKLASFRETDPALAYSGEIVGSIIPSFTPVGALGKVGQAVSKMGAVKKAATVGGTQGAIYGAGTSEGNVLTKEGLKNRAMGASIGGGLGLGLGAGVSSLFPKTSAAAQELLDLDIPVTVGQAFKGQGGAGKYISNIEETLTTFPGVGPSISDARVTGLSKFNKLAMLESVEPALTKSEAKILSNKIANQNGQDAFREVDGVMSDKYNDLLEDLVLPEKNIDNLYKSFSSILNREYKDILSADNAKLANALFNKPLNKLMKIKDDSFILEGKNLKLFEGELKEIAKNYKNKGGIDGEIGKIFEEMTQILKQQLDEANPGNELKNINKAWAQLATIKLAVNKASRNKGIFTTEQFLDAIKQADPTKGKSYTAKGKGLMQDIAAKGNEVFARVSPDSGTASRLVAGETLRNPRGAVPGVLGSVLGEVLYNQPVQNILRKGFDVANITSNKLVPYTSSTISSLLDSFDRDKEERLLSDRQYRKSLLER